MPTAPNTSFIPKRGPTKRVHQSASRQVHLFTIFSYIFFSATLIATVGVFFYERHIEGQRATQITSLDSAISSFRDFEMNDVLEFDSRLRQATVRLQNSVSTASILEALELATVQSVRIINLKMERDLDNQFNIEAQVQAESFDSSLFQRRIFERNSVIDEVAISDLEIAGGEVVEGEAAPIVATGVTFNAKISVPVSAVPYEPSAQVIDELLPSEAVATTSDVLLDETEEGEVSDDSQNSL